MKIAQPEKRLNSFWGKVDDKHVQSIAKYIVGDNVLDVGCGMGSTTNKLNTHFKKSKSIIGIDYESDEVEKAKSAYPQEIFMVANCENLPFENESFDTIIMRDALHHLFEESNFELVKMELLRVLKKGGRIITLDPNVNWWMRKLRQISKHEDAECSFKQALDIYKNQMKLKLIKTDFHTIFSLPLSGGYVGYNFVPDSIFLWKLILLKEAVFEQLFKFFGIAEYTTWRYLIVGEKS